MSVLPLTLSRPPPGSQCLVTQHGARLVSVTARLSPATNPSQLRKLDKTRPIQLSGSIPFPLETQLTIYTHTFVMLTHSYKAENNINKF